MSARGNIGDLCAVRKFPPHWAARVVLSGIETAPAYIQWWTGRSTIRSPLPVLPTPIPVATPENLPDQSTPDLSEPRAPLPSTSHKPVAGWLFRVSECNAPAMPGVRATDPFLRTQN